MNRFRIDLVLLIIGMVLHVVGCFIFTTQEKTKIGPIAIEHRLPASRPGFPRIKKGTFEEVVACSRRL